MTVGLVRANLMWINRDPIAEKGFQLLGKTKKARWNESPNLYWFTKNNPLTKIDAFGLAVLKSVREPCDPEEELACENTCFPNGGKCFAWDFYWVWPGDEEGTWAKRISVCICDNPPRNPPLGPAPVPVLPPFNPPKMPPVRIFTPIVQCH